MPIQALAGYIHGHELNAHIPWSYYSDTYHCDINVLNLTVFITNLIKTPEDKAELINREYFRLHQIGIENWQQERICGC